jgi:hypothetical protein
MDVQSNPLRHGESSSGHVLLFLSAVFLIGTALIKGGVRKLIFGRSIRDCLAILVGVARWLGAAASASLGEGGRVDQVPGRDKPRSCDRRSTKSFNGKKR